MITVGFIRLTNCQSTNERKKMQNLRKTNETGRSMVEMLGVLAIIGVLSVTGVAGYKAAVRKALANNLLNQASMRATDVATQIGSGNLDSLGNDAFDGNLGSGVTMSSAVKGPDGYADYDESDEQFTLTLEGLDEELCQQMQSMAGGSRSVVRAVLCDGDKAILTFNKDLSANPVSSDFDGNKEGCESSGRTYCDNDTCIPATEECPTGETIEPACADVTCPEGLTCFHGECKCSNGLFVCGEQCCAEGTYCARVGSDNTKYACAEPTSGCTKNSDCKDADGNVDTTKYCNFSGGSCTGPTGGACMAKESLTEYTLTLPKGDLTVYKSSGAINWWSAANLCAAHGKQMVTMADLGIADSGTNTICYFNSGYSYYETSPCICNGGLDSDCSETDAAIRGALGESGYFWLAETGKSSYRARRVYLFSGLADSGSERHYYNPALCR